MGIIVNGLYNVLQQGQSYLFFMHSSGTFSSLNIILDLGGELVNLLQITSNFRNCYETTLKVFNSKKVDIDLMGIWVFEGKSNKLHRR